MADELVHYSTERGTATITLDSPHNRNALSSRLRRELSDGLARAIADNEVRVIVLDHTGTVFCSGMDLKESRTAERDAQGVNEFPAILQRIWTSPKPVIGKLAGPARAGGVGMVAACDIAVAARTATFAFSEVRIGVIPAVISVTVLPRLTPRAAHELFLTGDTFDAERAVAIGLLNAAVDLAELDSTVTRYTDLLALGGPTALAGTKELLRRPRSQDMAAEFTDMLRLSAERFTSAEGQEGIAAFAQKRPAAWVPGDSGSGE